MQTPARRCCSTRKSSNRPATRPAYASATGRIPDILWTEAAAIDNANAEKLRRAGELCPDASAATIRDWCIRKRDKIGVINEDRQAFAQARAAGRRAPPSRS